MGPCTLGGICLKSVCCIQSFSIFLYLLATNVSPFYHQHEGRKKINGNDNDDNNDNSDSDDNENTNSREVKVTRKIYFSRQKKSKFQFSNNSTPVRMQT